MTKAEKEHLNKVARLGCCACRVLGINSPAGIHHITHGAKRDHFKTIPLCGPHHQTGGFGVAIHQGLDTWQKTYGTEQKHLEETLRRVGGSSIATKGARHELFRAEENIRPSGA